MEFIDSYQVLENTTLNHSEYVYKTDTKWTTQASFMIAKALIGRLDDRFNEGIDPTGTLFDIKSFDFQTYKGLLLGNVGMRAGENFTGREDFTIITPSYNTNLSYQGTDEEADKAGSFYETLINLDHLQPADPYTYSAYSAYLNGGADYHRVITNSRQPLAPKALFIHDSMALPLAAFSSLGFSETHMYWPGISPDNSFNVLSYVIEHDIDYVFFVSECDPYALKSIFEVVMR